MISNKDVQYVKKLSCDRQKALGFSSDMNINQKSKGKVQFECATEVQELSLEPIHSNQEHNKEAEEWPSSYMCKEWKCCIR